ncbi:hypothetical protein K7X08_034123 [Anisodus acutangulus]|uniref:Uncharacterized protein n=1 Tax=Anisodus acutangulus TaxID=402998 RepID=A0A9Q1LCY7_9SOLA|nr:hypothetical protein K7X08_034123 [Anisodus acutangulus]
MNDIQNISTSEIHPIGNVLVTTEGVENTFVMDKVEIVVEENEDEETSVEKDNVSVVVHAEIRDEVNDVHKRCNDTIEIVVEKNEDERNSVETNNVSTAILVEIVNDGCFENEIASKGMLDIVSDGSDQSGVMESNDESVMEPNPSSSDEEQIKEDDVDNELEKFKEINNEASEECFRNADVVVESFSIKEYLQSSELDKVEEEDIMQKKTNEVTRQTYITPKDNVKSSKKGKRFYKIGGDGQKEK